MRRSASLVSVAALGLTTDDPAGDTIVGGGGIDGYLADPGDRVISAELVLVGSCFD